jgi:hypothetical protein
MPKIDSLVNELNELCNSYIAHKHNFNKHECVNEILKDIAKQNYDLALPVLETNRPEFILLSEEGKMNFEKMKEIRKQKLDAIRKQRFEWAAGLRNEERILEKQIAMDLFIQTGKKYFFLINKLHKTVIVNDPDRHLKGMFRSQF